MDCSPESLFSFAIQTSREKCSLLLLFCMFVPLKSLPFIEECRLTVVRNWTMRNIFWPKLVEEAGEWIYLHNEDFSPFFLND
jgi:hypothetical protein